MLFRSIFKGKASRPRQRSQAAGKSNRLESNGLSAQTLRLLDRLRLNTGPFMPGPPTGSRTSQMRRPAADFRDHRQYTPGDDVRYVDWKASARQEHVFVKQGETQKAAVVYIIIDCSGSMGWGSPPKNLAALALANALSYLALAHNDRLVIAPLSGMADPGAPVENSLRMMGPFWGKGQAPMINRFIEKIHFQGQINLANALVQLSKRKLSQGGLVLAITDMFGSGDLAKALSLLPAPAWKVVFCHMLHPDEIHPELRGYLEMQDIETRQKKLYQITPKVLDTYQQRFQAWQESIMQICLEKKAVYTMLQTNWSLENEMIPQLQRIQVVERL